MLINVMFLCLCLFRTPDAQGTQAEDRLQAATHHLVACDTMTFDMAMTLDFSDGARTKQATVSGKVTFGAGANALILLETEGQKIRVYNTAEQRILFRENENSYSRLPVETKRHLLVSSMLSGPLEVLCQTLGGMMGGAAMQTELDPSDVEINGGNMHKIKLVNSAYLLHLYLSADATPLLLRMEAEAAPATLRIYSQAEDAYLRLSADFSNWTFNAPISDTQFVFTPPPDAREMQAGAPNAAKEALVGTPAPDFSLPLLDGGVMKLSSHRDKNIVILDFWASWCGPCRMAMPVVAQVAEYFKKDGVVLYAVNLREEPEKIRGFLERTGLSVAVAMDRRGEVGPQFGVKGIPHLAIIGKDGLFKAVHSGMHPELEQQLKQEISRLLDEK